MKIILLASTLILFASCRIERSVLQSDAAFDGCGTNQVTAVYQEYTSVNYDSIDGFAVDHAQMKQPFGFNSDTINSRCQSAPDYHAKSSQVRSVLNQKGELSQKEPGGINSGHWGIKPITVLNDLPFHSSAKRIAQPQSRTGVSFDGDEGLLLFLAWMCFFVVPLGIGFLQLAWDAAFLPYLAGLSVLAALVLFIIVLTKNPSKQQQKAAIAGLALFGVAILMMLLALSLPDCIWCG